MNRGPAETVESQSVEMTQQEVDVAFDMVGKDMLVLSARVEGSPAKLTVVFQKKTVNP